MPSQVALKDDEEKELSLPSLSDFTGFIGTDYYLEGWRVAAWVKLTIPKEDNA